MKNCPGMPGSSAPRSSRTSVYGPDRLDRDDATTLAPQASASIRSCSESAVSARAFAIAWTAAAAAASVVMHGTRAASAASRIR